MSASETRLANISPAPSEEEAAAIVAAIGRFMRATAATARAPEQPVEAWQRAAIVEGVARSPHAAVPNPWINT